MGHREGFEVIVFDNGSDGREVRLILHTHAQRKKIPIRIIHQKPNIGFSRGFNKAVQHADGNHIFLISDDVVIYGDIIEPATRHPWDDVLIGHRMIPAGSGWNDFPEISIPYLDGYFLATLRATWDKLGGFDETFVPHDFEDVDLAHRARQEGMKILPITELPIRHAAASTIGYGDERFEHTVRMRALFAEKWGLTNDPERP
jgi:GT2 family glycosyltransferase